MPPNASPFFGFCNRTVLVQRNPYHHQVHYNNNSSTLLKNHLKSVKETFAAVNVHYLKDNFIESDNDFSSPSVVNNDCDQSAWLRDIRYVTSMQLESVRKTIVKQTMKEKMEVWQNKKDEMSRNKKPDVSFKSKFQREDILLKRNNYKMILEQIHRTRAVPEQTSETDHQRRSREIFFKVTLAKAIFIVNILNNYLADPQLVTHIGTDIDNFHSMKLRLNALKNIKFVDEAPLIAVQSLLKDLALFKNNVVIPAQAKMKTCQLKIDCKKKHPLNVFSVNIPDTKFLKSVRRQYVSLVKNNKALIQNVTDVKNLPFINEPTAKSFRQNVTKVINTLVNTISSSNAVHLTEKYNQLDALLSGRLVSVGNTHVMIGGNKEALAFCMDTLAQKIITYAEEVMCIKTRVAYEISEVIVKLWSTHEQFGKILLAEMKQKCPLLVPFYYPVAKCLSDKKLDYKSFGFKFDSLGNVETHEKYLKRMTGIIRLYAAIIITSSKYNQSVLGLSQAWIFVAGTLNQNPIADITATMLVEFLNITGFSMHQMYGKQYIKLLQYINTNYLKKIIMVTSAGYGGPITRLNSFLLKSLCGRSIEKPKDMLPSNFW